MRYGTLYERLVANADIPVDGCGCWIWKGRISNNYPRLNVVIDGKHTTLLAHRTMCEIILGLPVNWLPREIEVDHLCKHPWCIHPDHLEACAQGVNQKRRDGHKTHCGVSWLLTPSSLDDIVWP